MIKNKISLEVQQNEKIFEFQCPPNAVLGELFDVLSKMRDHVIHLISQHETQNQENAKEVLSE